MNMLNDLEERVKVLEHDYKKRTGYEFDKL